METARPAGPADIEDMARLWAHAVAELDGPRGGRLLAGALSRPDLEGFLAAALDDPDRLFVIGFIDDVPVGLASARIERDRREAVADVELIFTEPQARQVGVGESMLEVVAGWSAQHDVVGLDAPALPGNRAAKSFFETQGFQARLLIMHRPGGRTGR